MPSQDEGQDCQRGPLLRRLASPESIQNLQECTEKGCSSCQGLIDIIGRTKPLWLSEARERDLSISIRPQQRWLFNSNLSSLHSGGSGTIRLLEATKPIDHLQLYRRITDVEKLESGDQDRFEKIVFGESVKIAPSSDSDLAFARASLWLRNCVEKHPACRPSDPDFGPRGLLRIQSPSDDQVTLVESSRIGPLRYAALSYCWGPDTSGVRTTVTSNMPSHARGIHVSELPQTVQDTIKVCVKLGVKYLWVDALCIVQDDSADWNVESARMMDIYANSFVTITAREPSSCKIGFLGRQQLGSTEWQKPIRARVPPGLGPSGDRLFVRGGEVEQFQVFSLDSRGWCLQENILPQRRLVFDGREMAWHCRERNMCECGHLDEDVDVGDESLMSGSIDGPKNLLELSQLHREWLKLVELYSRRFLTRSSDKLVALSGLARLFQQRLASAKVLSRDEHIIAIFDEKTLVTSNPPMAPGLPASYYAGLWRESFVLGLAWTVEYPLLNKTGHANHSKYKEYCAPSWSWASVDGPVVFRHMEVTAGRYEEGDNPQLSCDVKVRGITCIPRNVANPTGGVMESASVVLSGLLAPVDLATLHIKDDTRLWDYTWYNRMQSPGDGKGRYRVTSFARTRRRQSWRVLLDVEQRPTIEEGSSHTSCWTSPIGPRSDSDCCQWDDKTHYACLRLYTFQKQKLHIREEENKWLEVQMIVGFLVLRRVAGARDTYERIGFGIWDSFDGFQERWEFFKLFSDAKEETIKLV
ncbi:heterokaryon incompatibility protein [Colletotrichum kahawae]|uniref:Heterokaryon incompatibility protein n=1 Tax=Colletotrichum kahawae TaxID=34407 RepID=A0AAD9YJ50_COLKA|nr:heterokaryon incompatibility protein [Colletotrichum kahawae]